MIVIRIFRINMNKSKEQSINCQEKLYQQSRRHCNSMASLDYQNQIQYSKIKAARHNSQCHLKKDSSIIFIQYSEIERKLLKPLFDGIHSLKAKNLDTFISMDVLSDWDLKLGKGIRKLRQIFKANTENRQEKVEKQEEDTKKVYEEEMKKMEQVIQKLKEEKEEELRQSNNKLLQISTQFSKRDQRFKEIIKKCLDSMNNAQKKKKQYTESIMQKIKKFIQSIKQYLCVDQQNRQIYAAITNFTHRIMENETQHGEEIQQLMSQPLYRQNTIDMSSIEAEEEYFADDSFNICGEELPKPSNQEFQPINFEDCLGRMISWGFFSSHNHYTLSRLMNILKNAENPQALLSEPIYALILQSFRLSMVTDEQSILQQNVDRTMLEFREQQNQSQKLMDIPKRMQRSTKQLRQKAMGNLLKVAQNQMPKSATFKI